MESSERDRTSQQTEPTEAGESNRQAEEASQKNRQAEKREDTGKIGDSTEGRH